MSEEMKIVPPEGYEVDKEHSTFECIKFKPIKELPTTWEEFCETHPIKEEEVCIGTGSSVFRPVSLKRDSTLDRNILPSKKYAEAIRALCQLIQLRDCYNDGWKPDWNSSEYKECIEIKRDKVTTTYSIVISKVLSFKSEELRNKFLENFSDLIEIAKPLL